MRRVWMIAASVMLLLTGCGDEWAKPANEAQARTIIDWVDFVMLEGNLYGGMREIAVADPALVTDKVVGTIRFHVKANVFDPGYRIKDGDAAYLAEGTELYEIDGLDPGRYAAVRDSSAVHGYKVYFAREKEEGKTFRYADIDQDKVARIDVYEGDADRHKVASYEGDDVARIFRLLSGSAALDRDQASRTNLIETAYSLVFLADDPIAHVQDVYRIDSQFYYYPEAMHQIDEAIGAYLAGTN